MTLRRLNRAEYNNTVRDLLGTEKRPADTFPPDDVGHGFDNSADALAVSPNQVEQYATAAESLVSELLNGPKRATVVPCDPATDAAACVGRIIKDFGLRAFRRPITDAEAMGFMRLYELGAREGGKPDAGLQLVLEAMLISPHFLYMVELDPQPQAQEPHALGSYELATRLSHFLWSTTPDPTLLQKAAESVSRPDALLEQVSRMLDDPRSQALAENFAGQWLLYRDLPHHEAEAGAFPAWNTDLARSMQLETELMFREFMAANAQSPLLELLTANYTYVDERLAKHYGWEARYATAQPLAANSLFKRIDLTDTPRRGFLGHAGILTATSMPDRTSPTRRGVFVLSDLLCDPPDPPPPLVPDLPPVEEASTAGQTLREQLALHAKPGTNCYGCHTLFDPIGLGLEQFDGLGRFREQQDGQPIISAGKLPTGEEFTGPLDLIPLLSKDERLRRCAVEKLTTYALGRSVGGDDMTDSARVDYLTQTWKEKTGGTFRDLARLIATSRAFLLRRGDPLPPDSNTPGGAP